MIALDWNPSARTLRQFAAGAFALLVVAAALDHFRGGRPVAEAVFLTLAGSAAVFAWVRPQALRLPFVLLSLAVYPLGLVVSNCVLLVVFYGVITPLGVLSRLAGSDALALRGDGRVRTYWHERRKPRDKATYLRQA